MIRATPALRSSTHTSHQIIRLIFPHATTRAKMGCFETNLFLNSENLDLTYESKGS